MSSTPPQHVRRFWKLHVLGVLSAMILSACGSSSGASDDGDSGDGVTFAGVFCVCNANAYVAWKQGFFAEEGVEIDDFVTTAGGSDTFAALAGGDADFAISTLDAIMRGIATNIDVRGVATISPEFYALSVRSELEGEIQSVADLKGRKVSVSKVGSGSWGFLKNLLAEEGLTESDVEIVQLGGIDTTVAGLKRGTVDAAVTWEPGSTQGEEEGFSQILLDSLDPADHEVIYGSDASLSVILAVKDDLLEKDPELVSGAVRALNRANEWMAGHSAEEIAAVIESVAPGLDHDLLVTSVENTMATMPATAAVSEAAYTGSAGRLMDAQIIESVLPIEEVFDCEVGECAE
jgi:NitT/TauT family transport system substrate-binding protein